ncbi:4Fe-4S ferredoxin [Haematobacter massiliensis]|uniref:4Fe-4S ferredoxin n=1 Tax=Haematobacter massiliensis TaxID=195105 RepID=A0A086Y6M6_9RHOB|nr:4Fe-4S dicluster domain-containing protein [Haematobacter massiliensis]KFI29926.1 4Fe-4S ferredoxin [Haematobacter massiliensis]OWJ72935.1 4Fe-4S ferredoxin [Haematobacter massiliensis]OWJ81404.1 4Fe-4S ferredoxin [Haematobacter massiliensis]QBJ25434.1 4Fe-4S ferredoxin [Haematobacter massiliensis]
MIELISATRCTGCNICVTACPTNVFDAVKGSIPVIARKDDCQTCFMCEVWCPEDALYVDPDADHATGVTEAELERRDLFGSYRRAVGWAEGGRIAPPPEVMQRLR